MTTEFSLGMFGRKQERDLRQTATEELLSCLNSATPWSPSLFAHYKELPSLRGLLEGTERGTKRGKASMQKEQGCSPRGPGSC